MISKNLPTPEAQGTNSASKGGGFSIEATKFLKGIEKSYDKGKNQLFRKTEIKLIISGSPTSNALKSLTSVETAKLLQNLNKPKENLFEAKFLIYNKQGYLH